MKYKAFIFDMDGTIIATEPIWQKASKHLLKKYAKISDDECHAILPMLKGASLYTTCALIKKTFNLDVSVEQLMQDKEKHAFAGFENAITFIEGFQHFHEQLQKSNIPSAIATNATNPSIEKILQHVPLNNFFKEHIYGIDLVNKTPKPKPDIYLFAAEKLNIDPKDCIAIEDSAHGIAAAKAAGMFCIGINSGNDVDALAQADCIIQTYHDIDLDAILKKAKK